MSWSGPGTDLLFDLRNGLDAMTSARVKLQALLRELFQIEAAAELDFGIYRIMGQKREVIERFIHEELLDVIASELRTGTPRKEARAATHFAEAPEASIFNHLYHFFSRYYDKGDFMSLRRYSKREKYAIPYNGEEVHLHWANADQHYIKTSETLTDYRWKDSAGRVRIRFTVTRANVPQDNIKAPEKRYFLPQLGEVTIETAGTEKANERHTLVTVPFHYRGLTADETDTWEAVAAKRKFKSATGKLQAAVLAQAHDELLIQARIREHDDALAALTGEHHRDADGRPVSRLAHHLRRFTVKNTSDYFIHKDLGGFLTRELDFYLKNEVLQLDAFEAGGEARAGGWFQMLKVIRRIGGRIIAFLAQIENFQKRLFEKKKFVTECHYCMTIDRVPESLYAEIARNKQQIAEWKKLFAIDEAEGWSEPPTLGFLSANRHLVVDTQFFDDPIRFCAQIDELNGKLDGIMIHGENHHIHSLVAESLRQSVKAVYLDPPYNTGDDGFAYKDAYRHSSWMTMMAGRIAQIVPLCREDGLIFCSIDRDENRNLLPLLFELLGEENFVEEVVWQKAYGGGAKTRHVNNLHEYIECFARQRTAVPKLLLPPDSQSKKYYKLSDEKVETRGKYRLQPLHSNSNAYRENLTYPLPVPSLGTPRDDVWQAEWQRIRKLLESEKLVLDGGAGAWEWQAIDGGEKSGWKGGSLAPRKQWQWKWEKARQAMIDDELMITEEGGEWTVSYKQYELDENGEPRGRKPPSVMTGPYTQSGTQEIKDLFGYEATKFPKPSALVRDLISYDYKQSDAIFLDTFAGSGTTGQAVVDLNRAEGGSRKYVLGEMGEHFDSVLKPRLQRVVYSTDWKNGKPISRDTGVSHCFKYLRLESFEDALGNIAFHNNEAAQRQFNFDEYCINYMLAFETGDSETLLNIEKLTEPFDYKLEIRSGDESTWKNVDLPETFSFLIGLRTRSRQLFHRTHGKQKTKYLVLRGRTNFHAAGGEREVVVIWRTTKGWSKADFEADKQFVADNEFTKDADEVFVNSDSFVKGAKSLDPVFKRRMFNLPD